MDRPTRIVELANRIQQGTVTIDEYLSDKGAPTPSFDESAPAFLEFPPDDDIALIHAEVLEATRELNSLLLGSPEMLHKQLPINDSFALHVIFRYDIPSRVPIGGSITYEDLAKAAGIDRRILKRILRHAITSYIFREPQVGYVAHTCASATMARNEAIRCAVGIVHDEYFQAASRGADALSRDADLSEPTTSGWALANNATRPMFEELAASYPERSKVASYAMNAYATRTPPTTLATMYDWTRFKNGTVVDLGGNNGIAPIAIARHHPDLELKFIVQDLEGPVEEGRKHVATTASDLSDRIEFMTHDLFEEQPIYGADVYLFRSVFHDWPDKHCVKMLQALIPALKPGARVLVNDFCMPEPGVLVPHVERSQRNWDLAMLNFFNASERERDDWAQLFEAADTRFRFLGIKEPGLARTNRVRHDMSFIEAIWEP